MKRISLLTTALLMMAITVEAKPVSPETAQRVAENFMFQQTGKKVTMEMRTLPSSLKYLYLFVNTNGPGHVYIPTDDCAYPVLGYSLTSRNIAEIPQSEMDWIQGYSDEIEAAIKENFKAPNETLDLWQKYVSGQIESIPPSNTPIAPLLTTTWGTGSLSVRELYRYYTPLYHGVHTLVGCGAIAMAQVMKYYNWPNTGVGSYGYQHRIIKKISDNVYDTVIITPNANFGLTSYDWSNMPNTLTSTSSQTQIQAIALLLYHAGVSVNMLYSDTGSSSKMPSDGTLSKRCIENALKNHFRYSKNLHSVYQAAYSDSEWSNILITELSENRPVIYRGSEVSGSGHIWVCDGVNANGLFHFNEGGGSSQGSGYYCVTAVPNHDYPKKCAALIGIQPETTIPTGTKHIQTTSNNPSFGTTSVALKSQLNSTYQSQTFDSGDTVVIQALATDSTRFIKWSDGFIFNAREEIVNQNTTYTAIFEKVSGDTLYYDNGCCVGTSNWKNRTGTRAHCGIKLPPVTMIGHDSLKSVLLYSHYTGPFTLYIHIGENANQNNMVSSQSIHINRSMSWHSIQLNQPIQVDIQQPIWILFRPDSAGYAMPYSPSSGNDNGYQSCYNYSSWNNSIGGVKYTWMVRGIFSRGDSANISAISYNILDGSVSGGGRYPYGSRVTLTAIPNFGYSFHQWSDGDTSNPRIVYATQNTSLVAYFTQASNICDTIYIHDTTVVSLHDTTIVHDTTVVSLHDTTIVHDTTMVTLHDTTIVHDTTVVTLHDTTIVHDTTTVTLHDTTILTLHDTTIVHDTTILTMHDTTIVYHLIHDTTYIDIHDTTYLVDTLRETDTIYIFDTIYLHDTVYINNNDIKGVEGVHAKIYQQDGWLVVEGAGGKRVTLYDAVGRILATRMGGEDADGNVRAPRGKVLFDIPAVGVYLVKVGDLPARKAVVVW